MKKIGLLLAAVILTANVFAQEVYTKGKKYAHWSIALKGGGNYFRISPDDGSFWKKGSWNFGGNIDYNANPFWGMGIEVNNLNYNRPNCKGHITDGDLYTSINITNLVAPNRPNNWKKLQIYTNLGLGVGYYDHELSGDYEDASNYKWTPFGVASLIAEVKLSNCWAFFAEGQYRYYTKGEFIGGVSNGQLGGDAAVGNLGFRFKFNANKRDGGHIRNITPEAAQGKNYDNEIAALQDQLAKANAAAKEAENAAKRANDEAAKAKKAQEDAAKALADKDKNLQDQIDALKAAQSAPAATVQKALEENKEAATLEGVTFEYNSAELTEESKGILDHVATILRNNTNWSKIEVAGYTDNKGGEQYNTKLSEERANTVAKYLSGKGVQGNKLQAKGYGSANPVASNNTDEGRAKNRRVELHFAK